MTGDFFIPRSRIYAGETRETSMRPRGSGPICRNGPKGTLHKLGLFFLGSFVIWCQLPQPAIQGRIEDDRGGGVVLVDTQLELRSAHGADVGELFGASVDRDPSRQGVFRVVFGRYGARSNGSFSVVRAAGSIHETEADAAVHERVRANRDRGRGRDGERFFASVCRIMAQAMRSSRPGADVRG